MGESDLEVVFDQNNQKYNRKCDNVLEAAKSVDLFKSMVQSLLKIGKVHDALNSYINACSSDFLDLSCLEVFIDGLVKNAREHLTKNVLNICHFLCTTCCDVMREPVTLKCGHTFSKNCLLAAAQGDSVECKLCGKWYSYFYVSQLKTNVTVSALIEIIWRTLYLNQEQNRDATDTEIVCDTILNLGNNFLKKSSLSDGDVNCYPVKIQSQLLSGYLNKEEFLVNLKSYGEVIKMHLMCYTFDPSSVQAKGKAIKLFRKFLLLVRNLCQETTTDVFMNIESDSRHSPNAKRFPIAYDDLDQNDVFVCYSILVQNFHNLLDSFFSEMIAGEDFIKSKTDTIVLDKKEFECALCIRILWEPVSTPCGHTFCRVCLNRCLDHQPACPLCKTSLANFLAERVQNTTDCLEMAIKTLFPGDYIERKTLYEKEMKELYNAGKDPEHVIPLFICTVAYPTVPCPLHVFEPRYRLMIRQCMESGSRHFGMCAYIDNDIAEYGTMLEIRDVKFFPDGRSIVDTIGSRRFRILKKGERDGYNTAAIEYLKDELSYECNIIDIKNLHDEVYKTSQAWFVRLPKNTKHEILSHFGPMPDIEANYVSSINGPSWFWWMVAVLPVESRSQIIILSMTSLLGRLKILYRILLYIESKVV